MSPRVLGQRLATSLVLAIVALPLHAQESLPVQHVLFVGNSYVDYNNLPELVEVISMELSGPQLQTEAHTHGGFTLRAHLDDGHIEELLTRGDPDGNPWSAVILQEQSSLGMRGRSGVLAEPGEFFSAAQELDALIDAAGSRSYLYMTWAKEWIPGQTARLAQAYEEAGATIGAPVARVGLAWARVTAERPDLALYGRDGSHPTALGSYLAACVIYSELTGQTSLGAPAIIRGSRWNYGSAPRTPGAKEMADETIVLVSLDVEVAQYLQRVAWEVGERYRTE